MQPLNFYQTVSTSNEMTKKPRKVEQFCYMNFRGVLGTCQIYIMQFFKENN